MSWSSEGAITGATIINSSTGLDYGGVISVNGGDNTLINITAGTGQIIDSTTPPNEPLYTRIVWTKKTAYNLSTTAGPGDIVAIFLGIDSSGNVNEFSAPLTPEQRRDYISLGVVARNDADQIILVVNAPKNFIHNPLAAVQDFFNEWGSFSVGGNEILAYATDLQIKKTVGSLFGNGINARVNGKDPYTKTSAKQTPISPFNYKLSDGTDISLTATQINPDIYDDGTSTPATVPDGKFTVQLITMFPDSEVVEVFPGLTVYNLLSEAKAALPAIDPDIYKPTDSAFSINLAFLIVKKGTTDLTDDTTAEFFSLSKRGTLGGIGFQQLNSAGMVFDPGLTDHLDGSISVGEGVANLFQTNDFTGDMKQYTLTAFSQQTGTHTGANGAAILTDSTADFPDLTDMYVYNTTDGSSGLITANTATTITATLSGGTDNDWDTGDSYIVKLANEDTSYVIADYNSGSPIFRVTLDVLEINESDVVPVYTIYRSDNDIHILTWGTVGSGLVNKLHARFVKTNRFGYEKGLSLGETATPTARTITTTEGVIWVGGTRTLIPEADSSTDDTEFWYHVSGVWTKSAATTYNNTQYDDGTDLQTLLPNRYSVNWVYQGIEEAEAHLYYILGSGDYTLAQAQASTIPGELPQVISSHAVLVGRIIVERNAATATQIDSAFVTQFVSAAVTSHNALSGLQGGTTDEYYHLTSALYDIMVLIGNGVVKIPETTTPTPETDYGKIYTKNDNKLYFQDGSGTEHEIAFV